jgi:hypothetical protein
MVGARPELGKEGEVEETWDFWNSSFYIYLLSCVDVCECGCVKKLL